jgi:hypothetical protein
MNTSQGREESNEMHSAGPFLPVLDDDDDDDDGREIVQRRFDQ